MEEERGNEASPPGMDNSEATPPPPENVDSPGTGGEENVSSPDSRDVSSTTSSQSTSNEDSQNRETMSATFASAIQLVRNSEAVAAPAQSATRTAENPDSPPDIVSSSTDVIQSQPSSSGTTQASASARNPAQLSDNPNAPGPSNRNELIERHPNLCIRLQSPAESGVADVSIRPNQPVAREVPSGSGISTGSVESCTDEQKESNESVSLENATARLVLSPVRRNVSPQSLPSTSAGTSKEQKISPNRQPVRGCTDTKPALFFEKGRTPQKRASPKKSPLKETADEDPEESHSPAKRLKLPVPKAGGTCTESKAEDVSPNKKAKSETSPSQQSRETGQASRSIAAMNVEDEPRKPEDKASVSDAENRSLQASQSIAAMNVDDDSRKPEDNANVSDAENQKMDEDSGVDEKMQQDEDE